MQEIEPFAAPEPGDPREWIEQLGDEDLMFVKRFVLASGSMKDLARAYGISHPTVRLRLDRLIQKIQVLDAHRPATPFERRLRLLHAEGRIDLETLKTLLLEHQRALDGGASPRESQARPRAGGGAS